MDTRKHQTSAMVEAAQVVSRRELALERCRELERDAQRYRWLRLRVKDSNVWQPIDAPERLDADIDAALSAGGEG